MNAGLRIGSSVSLTLQIEIDSPAFNREATSVYVARYLTLWFDRSPQIRLVQLWHDAGDRGGTRFRVAPVSLDSFYYCKYLPSCHCSFVPFFKPRPSYFWAGLLFTHRDSSITHCSLL